LTGEHGVTLFIKLNLEIPFLVSPTIDPSFELKVRQVPVSSVELAVLLSFQIGRIRG
jgi:hypothetical protein